MTRVALGVGTSHSPQIHIPPEGWRAHGARGHDELSLAGGRPQLTKERLASEVTPEIMSGRADEVARSIEFLRGELARTRPDVVIVVGDDQRELFLDDNMPAFAVYWGSSVEDRPPGAAAYPETMASAYWAYHGDARESYEVADDLGRHLVTELVGDGFDMAQLSQQPADRTLGHAFTFVHKVLMEPDVDARLLPVFVNTYYPPNQPTAQRCAQFGRSLRKAIDSFGGDVRVALVASGGLSHPILSEELDRGVLDAIQSGDIGHLERIRSDDLMDGNSEIRNWIVVAAALQDLAFRLCSYVPGYRTSAGVGCGLAFATWTPTNTDEEISP